MGIFDQLLGKSGSAFAEGKRCDIFHCRFYDTAVVKSAVSTLSFSELEAILHIFDELGGHEGILVASKIADRAGITRSVIVNALRKFESAGVWAGFCI